MFMTGKKTATVNKVAVVQMCSTHNVTENLETVRCYIQEAISEGAKLIVLPEMFAIMGIKPTDKVVSKETVENGEIQSFLSQQARDNKIWIVAGTIPLECSEADRVRAASLVFNDLGICVARYDKIHLFDVTISDTEKYEESATTQPGCEPVMVMTPFGKIGLAVCYDIRFPELFRYYALNGANIITIPSAFTDKTGAHWDLLAPARAVENFCYILGSCQGGQHSSGRSTYGNSVIIDPWGTVIAKIEGKQAGIIYAMIDLNCSQKIRHDIPALSHVNKSLFSMAAERVSPSSTEINNQ